MPFGLTKCPKNMVGLTDMVSNLAIVPFCFVFLGDIIAISSLILIKMLKEVFHHPKAAGLTVNFVKCEFCDLPGNY